MMKSKQEEASCRRRWLSKGFSTKNNLDYKKTAGGKGSEDTSKTGEVSIGSASTLQEDTDKLCGLPKWENPLADDHRDHSPRSPSKQHKSRASHRGGAQHPPEEAHLLRSPVKQQQQQLQVEVPLPMEPPTLQQLQQLEQLRLLHQQYLLQQQQQQQQQQAGLQRENLENMIVVFNNSFSSIGEDITLCDFPPDTHADAVPPRQPQQPQSPPARRPRQQSLPLPPPPQDYANQSPTIIQFKAAAAADRSRQTIPVSHQDQAPKRPLRAKSTGRPTAAAATTTTTTRPAVTTTTTTRPSATTTRPIADITCAPFVDTTSRPSVSRTTSRSNTTTSIPRPAVYSIEDDAKAAERIQEEEIIRLALERSLLECNPPPPRVVPVISRPTVQSPPPPQQQHQQQQQERRSLGPSSKILTDALTGAQFMWQKGPNNRYIKVTVDEVCDGIAYTHHALAACSSQGGSVNHNNNHNIRECLSSQSTVERGTTSPSAQRRGGGGGSSRGGKEQSVDAVALAQEAKLTQMEQQMVDEALARSLETDRNNNNRQQPASTTATMYHQGVGIDEEKLEQKLIELALERSLEGSSSTAVSSLTSQQQQSPVKSRSKLSSNNAPSRRALPPRDSKTTAAAAAANFIWKKGPNNRYYKCPIGLDQVDEGEVYHEHPGGVQPQQHQVISDVERMEQQMLDEALARSLEES